MFLSYFYFYQLYVTKKIQNKFNETFYGFIALKLIKIQENVLQLNRNISINTKIS